MSAPLAPGAIVAGDYRIVQMLAHDHQATAYLVEQLSTQRQRAMKLMRPELVASAEQRERFEREARVGARIPSGHVVEVQAAGVDPQLGRPYLVTELLAGETLDAAVARTGPFSPTVLRQVFEQVAHAVGAAHGAGIVHGALEPAQVFLAAARRTDVAYTVKLLDFGIARLIAEQTSVTAPLRSPLWLAPEQLQGAVVTPATDVWAFGLLVHFALTGSVYWRSGSQPGSPGSVVDEVLRAPLPAASTRAAEVGRPLAVDIDEWFARAVARSPAARFGDVREAWEVLTPRLGPVSLPAPAVLPHAIAARTDSSQMAPSGDVPADTTWGTSAANTTFRGTAETDWSTSAANATFRGTSEGGGAATRVEPGATALVTKRRRVGWALGCVGLSAATAALGVVVAGGVAVWIWSSRAPMPTAAPAGSVSGEPPPGAADPQREVAAPSDTAPSDDPARADGHGAAPTRPTPATPSRPPAAGGSPRAASTPAPAVIDAGPPTRLRAGGRAQATIVGLVVGAYPNHKIEPLPPGAESTVKQLEPQASSCLRQAVAVGHRAQSNALVNFRLKIAASGAILGTGIYGDLSPPGVGLCVKPSVNALRFAAPPRETTVLITLNFAPMIQQ